MDFLWLVIVGGFVAFAMAWGIGANDVANAFATSVGAKCLTLKQAVLVAAIFEFAGAFALGKNVTDTVRKKIVNYKEFQNDPEVFMLGMFCALLSAAFWLALATRFSLPVSTTHSIIGAIIGFGLAARGPQVVDWLDVGMIVISWVASPAIAAVLGVTFFYSVRQSILRFDDAAQRSVRFFPVFIFLVAFIMCLFTIWKGLSKFGFNKIEAGPAIGISAAIAAGVTAIVWFPAHKMVLQPILEHEPEDFEKKSKDTEGNPTAKQQNITVDPDDDDDDDVVFRDEQNVAGKPQTQRVHSESRSFIDRVTGFNVDIHGGLTDADRERHDRAEKFDPRAEKVFSYLQVATACLDIFAHGANDVANSIAPFAAMIMIYELAPGEQLSKKAEVPLWILAFGGAGMVIGLATYGYNIIRAIGVRLVTMSCTRGYSIELSSALTVIIASRLGIPVSTTHVQVGATLGVGILEGEYEDCSGINWKLMAEVFAGWIFTLVITGLTSAAVFSFLAFSPKNY